MTVRLDAAARRGRPGACRAAGRTLFVEADGRGDKPAVSARPRRNFPAGSIARHFSRPPVCPPARGPGLFSVRRRARGRMCTPSIRAANGVRTGRTTVVRSGDEPSSPGPAGWFDPLTCGRIRLGRWSISPSGLGAPSSATRGKPPDGRPRGRVIYSIERPRRPPVSRSSMARAERQRGGEKPWPKGRGGLSPDGASCLARAAAPTSSVARDGESRCRTISPG